jgi:ribosomal protein L44E
MRFVQVFARRVDFATHFAAGERRKVRVFRGFGGFGRMGIFLRVGRRFLGRV